MTTRDPRTGRFVATANAPESSEGKFSTYTELPVEVQGANPADLTQGGQASPLRADNHTLVHQDDATHTVYGAQGAVLRSAVRRSAGRWDDPTAFLVGLESHGIPATDVQEITADADQQAVELVRGGLRPASRAQGRGRGR